MAVRLLSGPFRDLKKAKRSSGSVVLLFSIEYRLSVDHQDKISAPRPQASDPPAQLHTV